MVREGRGRCGGRGPADGRGRWDSEEAGRLDSVRLSITYNAAARRDNPLRWQHPGVDAPGPPGCPRAKGAAAAALGESRFAAEALGAGGRRHRIGPETEKASLATLERGPLRPHVGHALPSIHRRAGLVPLRHERGRATRCPDQERQGNRVACGRVSRCLGQDWHPDTRRARSSFFRGARLCCWRSNLARGIAACCKRGGVVGTPACGSTLPFCCQ
mmetsp:Transcript_58387/g.173764  ORF Transcript_58387/g.173764 Transcript_58387/m.173764 type:complete len:216 (-) Transcript_58387:980-1627(-)